MVHMEQCSTKGESWVFLIISSSHDRAFDSVYDAVDACISQATSSCENHVEISSKVPNESGSFIPGSGPSRREGSENNSLAVTKSPSSDCHNSTATSPSVSSVDSKLSLFPGQLASSNPPATTTNLVGYDSVKVRWTLYLYWDLEDYSMNIDLNVICSLFHFCHTCTIHLSSDWDCNLGRQDARNHNC